MSEITIRKAELKDLAAVRELQAAGELVFSYGPIDPEEITDEKSIAGVAESHGEIVGIIVGEKLAGPWSVAHYLVIRRDFRGGAVARELGQWFLGTSKAMGVQHVLAYADVGNPRLINLYKYFGFAAGGTYVELTKEI
ncbi:MAG: GNAT family N-acetyltransferase [Alphaproteobacteria bacterium]|nr:GNAT family N-acetyltransferase [Alphaproteobacteria bacterium]